MVCVASGETFFEPSNLRQFLATAHTSHDQRTNTFQFLFFLTRNTRLKRVAGTLVLAASMSMLWCDASIWNGVWIGERASEPYIWKGPALWMIPRLFLSALSCLPPQPTPTDFYFPSLSTIASFDTIPYRLQHYEARIPLLLIHWDLRPRAWRQFFSDSCLFFWFSSF